MLLTPLGTETRPPTIARNHATFRGAVLTGAKDVVAMPNILIVIVVVIMLAVLIAANG